jgi:hypothetical protein
MCESLANRHCYLKDSFSVVFDANAEGGLAVVVRADGDQ